LNEFDVAGGRLLGRLVVEQEHLPPIEDRLLNRPSERVHPAGKRHDFLGRIEDRAL
jgi:hypothetical protein